MGNVKNIAVNNKIADKISIKLKTSPPNIKSPFKKSSTAQNNK